MQVKDVLLNRKVCQVKSQSAGIKAQIKELINQIPKKAAARKKQFNSYKERVCLSLLLTPKLKLGLWDTVSKTAKLSISLGAFGIALSAAKPVANVETHMNKPLLPLMSYKIK